MRQQAGNPTPALPCCELRRLKELILLAADRADSGDAADGYVCLLEGSCRVRELGETGESWAPVLVTYYKDVLDAYAARYRVARE